MPLTYTQIESKFASEGIIISRVYVNEGTVVFLELLFIQMAETCFIYVSSRHDVKAPSQSTTNTIIADVEDIDVDPEGSITGDLTGAVQKDSFNYPELTLNGDLATNKLSQHYNNPIKLGPSRDIVKEELKQIFRQVIRLRQCVNSLDYKFVIVYKEFLCALRYDNDLQCFWVKKGQSKSSGTRLVVYIELESMIEKINSVKTDIASVREGLITTLKKNELHHIESLKNLLRSKIQVPEKMACIIARKERLYEHIEELYRMLDKLSDSEYVYSNKYRSAKSEKQIESIRAKFDKIKVLKQQIIANILNCKSQYDELILSIDRICFDNSIMIDAVTKNFENLNKY